MNKFHKESQKKQIILKNKLGLLQIKPKFDGRLRKMMSLVTDLMKKWI